MVSDATDGLTQLVSAVSSEKHFAIRRGKSTAFSGRAGLAPTTPHCHAVRESRNRLSKAKIRIGQRRLEVELLQR
jgi:hypothetical protein